MKILFVNALLGGDFSALDISITRLATFINERTSHKADILDMVFHVREWKSYFRKCVLRFRPDVIAMSANTMYMQYVKTIAKEAGKYGIKVIVGGYHASLKPLETLSVPDIDAVCIGDGEFVISQYLDNMEQGKSVKGIKGIWAKEDGKIIKNPIGAFNEDLDSLPIPDWDMWRDLKKYFYYLGMLYFIGNMGCPYRCIYCDAHPIASCVKGNYYRRRDPVKYAEEIHFQWNKYQKKGMRLAQLFDQIPTVDKKWLKSFCTEYKALGNVDERKYSMFSRIDHLDEEKIKMLAKSGCALLRVGVEAGNDYIRNEVYKKNLDMKKINDVFKLCKRHGIGLTAFYMVGGPGETRKTINQTINLARKLNANRSAFFVFKPFTDESKVLIEKYGGKIDEARWKKADNITYDAVVKLKDISPGQVEFLQYKAYFLTFSRRLAWMVGENPIRYSSRFITYMTRGLNDGLDIKYLLPYFHIYGYDYVRR